MDAKRAVELERGKALLGDAVLLRQVSTEHAKEDIKRVLHVNIDNVTQTYKYKKIILKFLFVIHIIIGIYFYFKMKEIVDLIQHYKGKSNIYDDILWIAYIIIMILILVLMREAKNKYEKYRPDGDLVKSAITHAEYDIMKYYKKIVDEDKDRQMSEAMDLKRKVDALIKDEINSNIQYWYKNFMKKYINAENEFYNAAVKSMHAEDAIKAMYAAFLFDFDIAGDGSDSKQAFAKSFSSLAKASPILNTTSPYLAYYYHREPEVQGLLNVLKPYLPEPQKLPSRVHFAERAVAAYKPEWSKFILPTKKEILAELHRNIPAAHLKLGKWIDELGR